MWGFDCYSSGTGQTRLDEQALADPEGALAWRLTLYQRQPGSPAYQCRVPGQSQVQERGPPRRTSGDCRFPGLAAGAGQAQGPDPEPRAAVFRSAAEGSSLLPALRQSHDSDLCLQEWRTALQLLCLHQRAAARPSDLSLSIPTEYNHRRMGNRTPSPSSSGSGA